MQLRNTIENEISTTGKSPQPSWFYFHPHVVVYDLLIGCTPDLGFHCSLHIMGFDICCQKLSTSWLNRHFLFVFTTYYS